MLTSVFIAAVSLALFWMAAFTLWWQMHAWRTPERPAAVSLRGSGASGGTQTTATSSVTKAGGRR